MRKSKFTEEQIVSTRQEEESPATSNRGCSLPYGPGWS